MKPLHPSLESLSTVKSDGSRNYLHPADVKGGFTLWRRIVAVVLVAVYVALPWIKIGGYPAVFLDVAHRRFHLFGLTVAQQDLWMAFFLITGLGFTLFVVTALFGRLWCGWACPQTVFLEHVFRRVERVIEGDAPARMKLDRKKWTDPEKLLKRGVKQVLYFLLSALIAHIFLSYFVSLPRVYEMMTHAPGENWHTFVFIAVTTVILYFNFAWFREQLCIIICPYGRFQSALIDDHSMVIGYDESRGEPRGKAGKTEGDCVDCYRCVSVCPTGIDIRNGLQIECIGCANCIDACNDIMRKLKRPEGLIRYDSMQGLDGKKTRWLRPRIILYAVLMVVGIIVAGNSFSKIEPATFDATRMPGAPYLVSDEVVRNQFFIRIINKTNESARYTLSLKSEQPGIQYKGFESGVAVDAMQEIKQPLVIVVPRDQYVGEFQLQMNLQAADGDVDIPLAVHFLGPNPELLKADQPEQ